MSNTDFMKGGKLRFTKPGNKGAAVLNKGSITAKEAGLVGLVAPHVENSGTINAKLGRVELASGDTATIDLYGDGLLEIKASDAMTAGLAINTGKIEAEGGNITITAAEGKKLVDSLIIVEGELSAPTVKEQAGEIIIAGAGSNKKSQAQAAPKDSRLRGNDVNGAVITSNALINVSGLERAEKGGTIEITGKDIGILDNTIIAASGQNGGGDIKVGGDYLGTGETPTATNLYVSQSALTLNDALDKGDGGRTIFWADNNDRGIIGNVSPRCDAGEAIRHSLFRRGLDRFV
jgi:hypothetical protein